MVCLPANVNSGGVAMAIKWKKSPSYIAKCAEDYYMDKLESLRAGRLSLPIFKEMCLLNNIDTAEAYALAKVNPKIRALGAAIQNLQEIVLMKMLCSGKVSPTGIAIFLKAQHGWREGNEIDQFGANNKMASVNEFITDIGQMLQKPAPTRVNPYDKNTPENRALLTSETNKG